MTSKKELKRQQYAAKFLEKATAIHNGFYDYSKVEYVGTETKVIIICPIHGEFLQTPHNHQMGHDCPKCKGKKLRETRVINGVIEQKCINPLCETPWKPQDRDNFTWREDNQSYRNECNICRSNYTKDFIATGEKCFDCQIELTAENRASDKENKCKDCHKDRVKFMDKPCRICKKELTKDNALKTRDICRECYEKKRFECSGCGIELTTENRARKDLNKCKECQQEYRRNFEAKGQCCSRCGIELNEKNRGSKKNNWCIDCKLNRDRQYREEHRDEINAGKREYTQNRFITGARFKLDHNMRRNIWNDLNSRGASKEEKKWEDLVGFTVDQLALVIEILFEPWMNWDNRGVYIPDAWDDNDPTTWKWQLDHIKEISKFNYTSFNDPQFKECWSLWNLRPLSAKQNNVDSKRLRGEEEIGQIKAECSEKIKIYLFEHPEDHKRHHNLILKQSNRALPNTEGI